MKEKQRILGLLNKLPTRLINTQSAQNIPYTEYYYKIRRCKIDDNDFEFGLMGGYEFLLEIYKKQNEFRLGYGILNTVPDVEAVFIVRLVFSFTKPQHFHEYIKRITKIDIIGVKTSNYNDLWVSDDGGSDAGACWVAAEQLFSFGYIDWSDNNRVDISYSDSINLFYNYFKGFEIYVDEYLKDIPNYLQEQKEEELLRSQETIRDLESKLALMMQKKRISSTQIEIFEKQFNELFKKVGANLILGTINNDNTFDRLDELRDKYRSLLNDLEDILWKLCYEKFLYSYKCKHLINGQWYLEFKKELANLEIIYQDLVERGEIVEVKQPAVG